MCQAILGTGSAGDLVNISFERSPFLSRNMVVNGRWLPNGIGSKIIINRIGTWTQIFDSKGPFTPNESGIKNENFL